MEKVFPPFEVDIAGSFCVPCALREAREQYRNGQIGRQTLLAIEDAEVRSLVSRLKTGGMKVVTDGGFRSRDFMDGWEGVRCMDAYASFPLPKLELTGRISLSHHPVLDEFTFLTGVTGGDVLAKQHLPSPAEVMTRILCTVDAVQLETFYPERRLLADDLVACYRRLLTELCELGCRYVQFDGVHTVVTEETACLNNRVLDECPEELFVAFHAPIEMLIQLHGADAYFLNYDCGICDRTRLLWFIRERQAVFGFVLSHYPSDEEVDDLQARMEEVFNYIPLQRFTICLPDVGSFPRPNEADESRQWETMEMAVGLARQLFA